LAIAAVARPLKDTPETGLRVLVVEDETAIAEFVVRGLREEGFTVDAASDGLGAWYALVEGDWDLVVLDWWLPGMDGIQILKRMREKGLSIPVLFLTARDAVADRVAGLNAGADDYLCKPFAFEELLARVFALTRRDGVRSGTRIEYAGVSVDLAAHRVERDGATINLTVREQALLVFFLKHPEQVLPKSRLYKQVWDDWYDGTSNTLEVHVMSLRRALEAHGPRLIHTRRGRGYRFGTEADKE